jgi:hypothetical protein
MPTDTGALRIANCSGFYGDRLSAAREMVEGGPIDVLTGDWLAELTMLILAKGRARAGGGGWARTFVTQMEQVMGTCLDRGIKVVANAGGLDPAGCAEAVAGVADRLGLAPTIAHVSGDDLVPRWDELTAAGHRFPHLDTGEDLADRGVTPITANAYLGAWGIVRALALGADIVVTGRVTDAAVAVGPAAWHFGWERTDWDRLAAAVVAGHVIECGAQATGGNYAFFTEIADLVRPGFPIAEVAADGTTVITKHPGTGGAVTVGTVTAQLLYEIGGARYHNPDVTARFDTIILDQQGPDRVRITGVRGEPPPETLKVAINYDGGYRNSFTFALTGLEVEAKARLVERQLWAHVPGGREAFQQATVELIPVGRNDPPTNGEAVSYLRVTVKDPDERKVGRAFSGAAVELALASIPGFFGTSGAPGPGSAYGVYWPSTIPASLVPQQVVVRGGATAVVDNTDPSGHRVAVDPTPVELPPPPGGPTVRAPLGVVFGARSGDKGGNANVGVWARTDAAYAWLRAFLTPDRVRALLPEAAGLPVEVHPLDSIRAVNVVVAGLLEEGVAASTRLDPQAKGLGEYLRARVVDLPAALVSDRPLSGTDRPSPPPDPVRYP